MDKEKTSKIINKKFSKWLKRFIKNLSIDLSFLIGEQNEN